LRDHLFIHAPALVDALEAADSLSTKLQAFQRTEFERVLGRDGVQIVYSLDALCAALNKLEGATEGKEDHEFHRVDRRHFNGAGDPGKGRE